MNMPPTVTLRADSGTAQDFLDNIEHHQTHPGPDEHFEDPFSDRQPDEGLDVDREMDLLLAYPGPRQFSFYRAFPAGRMELHFEATLMTTLADIRQRLIQAWPDLPQQIWQLVALDPHWDTSPSAVPGSVNILVWAAGDLVAQRGAIIAMVETQSWNLATGSFDSSYSPLSLHSTVTFSQILTQLEMTDHCRTHPCAVRQNGIEISWRHTSLLWDAAYIVITVATELAHLRTILDPPTGINPVTTQSIPQAYAQLVAERGRREWHGSVRELVTNAKAMQISFSVLARSIFYLSGMHRLQQREAGITDLHAGPIQFQAFLHDASRDPYGLLFALQDTGLVVPEDSWQMFRFHASVAQLGLPPLMDYMCVVKRGQRPSPDYILFLVATTIQTTSIQSQSAMIRIRMVPRQFQSLKSSFIQPSYYTNGLHYSLLPTDQWATYTLGCDGLFTGRLGWAHSMLYHCSETSSHVI